jgi:hypothetical protein
MEWIQIHIRNAFELLNSSDTLPFIKPQANSIGIKFGDDAGQLVGPRRPVHLFGKCLFNEWDICLLKKSEAPSYCKTQDSRLSCKMKKLRQTVFPNLLQTTLRSHSTFEKWMARWEIVHQPRIYGVFNCLYRYMRIWLLQRTAFVH